MHEEHAYEFITSTDNVLSQIITMNVEHLRFEYNVGIFALRNFPTKLLLSMIFNVWEIKTKNLARR